MTETWLPVIGYEGIYEVSDHGNVRTVKTGKIKAPQKCKKTDHQWVMLWKDNTQKNMRIHRLVMFAFIGPPPDNHECCHNDGDASNNHISNLRWDTPAANQADRVKHGTSNRGERCASSKLTTEQIFAIYKDNRLQREIASDYGVRENTISRIKSGKRWSHLFNNVV